MADKIANYGNLRSTLLNGFGDIFNTFNISRSTDISDTARSLGTKPQTNTVSLAAPDRVRETDIITPGSVVGNPLGDIAINPTDVGILDNTVYQFEEQMDTSYLVSRTDRLIDNTPMESATSRSTYETTIPYDSPGRPVESIPIRALNKLDTTTTRDVYGSSLNFGVSASMTETNASRIHDASSVIAYPNNTVSRDIDPDILLDIIIGDGISLTVRAVNIVDMRIDVIVNAANGKLEHGGGIASVIASAGGAKFITASQEYIKKNGPLKTGDACITPAGGTIKAKAVIHAVGPDARVFAGNRWERWANDVVSRAAGNIMFFEQIGIIVPQFARNTYSYNQIESLKNILVWNLLYMCVKNSLMLASNNNFKSIAIPCIGSGIFKCDADVCGDAINYAIYEHIHKTPTRLKHIYLVDRNINTAAIVSMATHANNIFTSDNQLVPTNLQQDVRLLQDLGAGQFSPIEDYNSYNTIRTTAPEAVPETPFGLSMINRPPEPINSTATIFGRPENSNGLHTDILGTVYKTRPSGVLDTIQEVSRSDVFDYRPEEQWSGQNFPNRSEQYYIPSISSQFQQGYNSQYYQQQFGITTQPNDVISSRSTSMDSSGSSVSGNSIASGGIGWGRRGGLGGGEPNGQSAGGSFRRHREIPAMYKKLYQKLTDLKTECTCDKKTEEIKSLKTEILRMDTEHKLAQRRYATATNMLSAGLSDILIKYPELKFSKKKNISDTVTAINGGDGVISELLKLSSIGHISESLDTAALEKPSNAEGYSTSTKTLVGSLKLSMGTEDALLSVVEKYINLLKNYNDDWKTMVSKVMGGSVNFSEDGFISLTSRRPNSLNAYENTLEILAHINMNIGKFFPHEDALNYRKHIEKIIGSLKTGSGDCHVVGLNELKNLKKTLTSHNGNGISRRTINYFTTWINLAIGSVGVESISVSMIYFERMELLKAAIEHEKKINQLTHTLNSYKHRERTYDMIIQLCTSKENAKNPLATQIYSILYK